MPTHSSARSPRSLAARTTKACIASTVTALLLCACATERIANVPAAPDACVGWSMTDYGAARVVRRIRIYTDPKTGDSAMEETAITPKSTPLLKTGTILREYDFGPASKVQIVVGPPDLEIPLHPAPYREHFLILKGSVAMKLGNGQTRELLPGDMTVFEDTTATIGHGGRTGPCGYVSLDIVP